MPGRAKTKIKLLFKNTIGATAIEYGLIAFLIAVAILLSVKALGLSLECLYDNIAGIIDGSGGHACS